MIGLKRPTVASRIKKLKGKIEREKANHRVTLYKLELEIRDVQARCPHVPKAVYVDTWDGWDQHIDNKGHYDVVCTVCEKILESGILPSVYKQNPSGVLSKYHFELCKF